MPEMTMMPLPDGPHLLDGPTGTELERRGFHLPPPLWSAAAIDQVPELLESIHRDYIHAGATVITANTFRTNPATFALVDRSTWDANRATVAAVAVARRAVSGTSALVAGSVAPVGDCYYPGDQRSESALLRDHQQHIEHLVDAGPDLLLLETMNGLPEALIALNAAMDCSLPVLISLVTDRTGLSLLDGTRLVDGVRKLMELEPAAILLNCASPESTLCGVELIGKVAREEGYPGMYGGYPNGGNPDPVLGWDRVAPVADREFDQAVERMLDLGAGWVGSCCGTTPDTTARIADILERRRTGHGKTDRGSLRTSDSPSGGLYPPGSS